MRGKIKRIYPRMHEITKHFYLDKATCLNKYLSDDYNKYQSY